MKAKRVVAVLMAACWLAGCATDPAFEKASGIRVQPQPIFSVDGKGVREQTYPLEAVLAQSGVGATQRNAIIEAMHKIDEKGSVQQRNSAIGDLVVASEANCQVYLAALRGGQVTARVTLDTLTNLTAGAAAISRPTASAQLLAAFATFFNATGSSIDRNIFAQEGAEVITAEIESLRGQKLTQIRQGLAGDYASYPVAFALRDVIEYHGDCSVRKALGALPATVAARETAIKAIRIAAAKGFESNASGRTISDIIAGLTDLGGDTSQTSTTTPAKPAASDLTSDFTAFQADLVSCVAAIKLAAQKPVSTSDPAKQGDIDDAHNAITDPEKNVSACATKSNKWRDRFFDTLASQSKAAQPQIDKVYSALKTAAAGDKKALPAAIAAAKSDLDDIFAGLQDSIVTTLKVEQERSGHDRRETVRIATKAGQPDSTTAADVANTIDLTSATHQANATAGANAILDPMIKMISDAVQSVKTNPVLTEHSGAMAAAAATNAASAYDAAYRLKTS
jgi:hypothetical protein